MSPAAALRHEKSLTHVEKLHDYSIWNPQPDIAAWMDIGNGSPWDDRVNEKQKHVDGLKDWIPFWQQQVEAAHRGVELRWESFLDATETKEEEVLVWDVHIPDWAVDTVEDDKSCPSARAELSESDDPTGVWRVPSRALGFPDPGKDGLGPTDDDAYSFVEKIATQDLASDERRRQMHAFYKIPTQEKVTRIQELIERLHRQPT